MTLRWMTAGESHGPALTGIISGFPAGLEIDIEFIDSQLKKRQQGVGRSVRQEIESDRAKILSGVRHGFTIGSPVAVVVENKDHENWLDVMSVEKPAGKIEENPAYPRPGHADLAGVLKWGFSDSRNVLERASGRTTAVTVALGAICKLFLMEMGIQINSRIIAYGKEKLIDDPTPPSNADSFDDFSNEEDERIKSVVEEARSKGDTLGGVVQVVAWMVPPGLGSCALPDERLDARLAYAAMGVPGIKAVEIGSGIRQAGMTGREAQDEFDLTKNPESENWYGRSSNLAGGIEGGITNGEPVSLTAWMKPLSTISQPLDSIDLKTRKSIKPGSTERSDVAAVESAACVLEAVMAMELARAHREKFSGDSMSDVMASVKFYLDSLENPRI